MDLKERKLRRMRRPEIENYIEKTEKPTCLVPVGSIEQHGTHCCYGTDSIIPEEICDRVTENINALIAPTLDYGISRAHAGFPGIAYLSRTTMFDVISDIAYSLCEGGFDDVVFINGHYCNQEPIKSACDEVSYEIPPDKYVYGFSYWEALASEDLKEYISLEAGIHANIGETSTILAIDENLVDLENAECENVDIPKDIPNPRLLKNLLSISVPEFIYRVTESGVWGDPTKATLELGEESLVKISEAVSIAIDTFQEKRDEIIKHDIKNMRI